MKGPPSSDTGWSRVEQQLTGLCRAIGASEVQAEVLTVHRRMRRACRLHEPGAIPRWSGVTDDSTPFRYSVVFRRDGARLRLLFEPQADPASAANYWRAGKRCTRWLASAWNANTSSALVIEGLFKPAAPVFLSMGHGVEFYPKRPPMFKVYYNTMARGVEQNATLVGQALERLGLGSGWNAITHALHAEDRVELISLDLADVNRAKVYVRPLASSMEHLQELYAAADGARSEDLSRIWHALRGRRRPDRCRPIFITYQLTDPEATRPQRAVVSIPLYPDVANDRVVSQRLLRLFSQLEIPSEAYGRCLEILADRPLDQEEGIHTYAAFSRDDRGPAVVVYFNPRLYFRRFGWLARNPIRAWPSAVSRVTARSRTPPSPNESGR